MVDAFREAISNMLINKSVILNALRRFDIGAAWHNHSTSKFSTHALFQVTLNAALIGGRMCTVHHLPFAIARVLLSRSSCLQGVYVPGCLIVHLIAFKSLFLNLLVLGTI